MIRIGHPAKTKSGLEVVPYTIDNGIVYCIGRDKQGIMIPLDEFVVFDKRPKPNVVVAMPEISLSNDELYENSNVITPKDDGLYEEQPGTITPNEPEPNSDNEPLSVVTEVPEHDPAVPEHDPDPELQPEPDPEPEPRPQSKQPPIDDDDYI